MINLLNDSFHLLYQTLHIKRKSKSRRSEGIQYFNQNFDRDEIKQGAEFYLCSLDLYSVTLMHNNDIMRKYALVFISPQVLVTP